MQAAPFKTGHLLHLVLAFLLVFAESSSDISVQS